METVDDIGMFDDNFDSEEEAEETENASVTEDVIAPWLIEEKEAEEVCEPDTPASFEPSSDYNDDDGHCRFNFFWLDAYEDVKHQPGELFKIRVLFESFSHVTVIHLNAYQMRMYATNKDLSRQTHPE